MGQVMKKEGVVYIQNAAQKWIRIGHLDEDSKSIFITEDKPIKDAYVIPAAIVTKGWFKSMVITEDIGKGINVYNIPIDTLRKLPTIHTGGADPHFLIKKAELKQWKI
jgi:hypothetical protein